MQDPPLDRRQLVSDLDAVLNVYQLACDRTDLVEKELALLMRARIRRLEALRASLARGRRKGPNRARGRRESD